MVGRSSRARLSRGMKVGLERRTQWMRGSQSRSRWRRFLRRHIAVIAYTRGPVKPPPSRFSAAHRASSVSQTQFKAHRTTAHTLARYWERQRCAIDNVGNID